MYLKKQKRKKESGVALEEFGQGVSTEIDKSIGKPENYSHPESLKRTDTSVMPEHIDPSVERKLALEDALTDIDEQATVDEETLQSSTLDERLAKIDIKAATYSPTPVSAQTVFQSSNVRGSFQTWALVMLLMALVALITIFSMLFYYTYFSPDRFAKALKISAPSFTSQGGERFTETQGLEENNQTSQESLPILISEAQVQDIQSLENIEKNETEIVESTEDQAHTNPEMQIVLADMQNTEPVTTAVEALDGEQPPVEEIVTSEAGRGEFVVEKEYSPLEELQTDETNHSVVITKRRESNSATVDLRIRKAFLVYQSGDSLQAAALYRQVLYDMPSNRNALLGLAAIAIRQKDSVEAYDYYLKLLQMNPQDKFVQTALLYLFSEGDLLSRESQIKSLLVESPSPYAYFALGTVYADQARWSESSQAFFRAYAFKPNDPNYALNLAISLDQIGQYSTALEYYNIAIAFSDKGYFDVDGVIERRLILQEKLDLTDTDQL